MAFLSEDFFFSFELLAVKTTYSDYCMVGANALIWAMTQFYSLWLLDCQCKHQHCAKRQRCPSILKIVLTS